MQGCCGAVVFLPSAGPPGAPPPVGAPRWLSLLAHDRAFTFIRRADATADCALRFPSLASFLRWVETVASLHRLAFAARDGDAADRGGRLAVSSELIGFVRSSLSARSQVQRNDDAAVEIAEVFADADGSIEAVLTPYPPFPRTDYEFVQMSGSGAEERVATLRNVPNRLTLIRSWALSDGIFLLFHAQLNGELWLCRLDRYSSDPALSAPLFVHAIPRADATAFYAAFCVETRNLVIATIPNDNLPSRLISIFVRKEVHLAVDLDLIEDFSPLLPAENPPLTIELAGIALNANGENGVLLFSRATADSRTRKQIVVVFDARDPTPIRTLLIHEGQTNDLLAPLFFDGTRITLWAMADGGFVIYAAEITDEGLAIVAQSWCAADGHDLALPADSPSFDVVYCAFIDGQPRLRLVNAADGNTRSTAGFDCDEFISLFDRSLGDFGSFEIWTATTDFRPIEYFSCSVRSERAVALFHQYAESNGGVVKCTLESRTNPVLAASVLLGFFSVPEIAVVRGTPAENPVLSRELAFRPPWLLEATTKMNSFVVSVVSPKGASLLSGLTGVGFWPVADKTAAVGVTFVPVIDHAEVVGLTTVVGALFTASDAITQAVAFLAAASMGGLVIVDAADLRQFWRKVMLCCDRLSECYGLAFPESQVNVMLAGDSEAYLDLAGVPESSALYQLERICRFFFVEREDLSAETVASVEGCLNAVENSHLTGDVLLAMRKALAVFGGHCDLPDGIVQPADVADVEWLAPVLADDAQSAP
jgi:hypothetical protein